MLCMRISTRKEAVAAKHTFYFTGKECPRKHLSARFTYDARCRDCHREDSKANYSKRRKYPTGTTNRGIPIVNQQTGERFGSMANAAKSLGLSVSMVWMSVNGNIGKIKGQHSFRRLRKGE